MTQSQTISFDSGTHSLKKVIRLVSTNPDLADLVSDHLHRCGIKSLDSKPTSYQQVDRQGAEALERMAVKMHSNLITGSSQFCMKRKELHAIIMKSINDTVEQE